MIVVFNCPQCRRTLRADDYFSGKKIQCRNCKTVLFVPGAPPVRDGHGSDAPIASDSPDASDSYDAGDAAIAKASDAPLPTSASSYEPSEQPDNSYGLASLYLAAFSFLLFFTPALLAGMTGAIGASIAFFAGLFVNTGCFIFSWHGYRLAQRAEELPGGQGYAAAGKIVNKFFLRFYALGFVFFLVGGIITLIYVKHAVSEFQQATQVLEQLKGVTGR